MSHIIRKQGSLASNPSLDRVFTCLELAGFESKHRGLWINTNPDANIQQIDLALEPANQPTHLLVTAHACRAENADADLEGLGFCKFMTDEERRDELQRDLNKQKAYWETVRPYRGNAKDEIQWSVVDDALAWLRYVTYPAWHWNTLEGEQFPVSGLPDLASDEFRVAEPDWKDPNLDHKLNQALPLPGESLKDFYRRTRQLRLENESLPEKPNTASAHFGLAFNLVTFEQIIRSNEAADEVPLLPPVEADVAANGTARFSKAYLQKITLDFLQRQDAGQEELDRCRDSGGLLLWRLCHLRRERFDQHRCFPPELLESIRKPLEQPEEEKPTVVTLSPALPQLTHIEDSVCQVCSAVESLTGKVEKQGELIASLQKPPVPVEESKPSVPKSENVFRLAGEFWEIRFQNSKSTHLKDRVGLRYIHWLIEHPDKEFSAVELGQAIDKTCADSDAVMNRGELTGNLETQQPVWDENAFAAVRRKMEELDKEWESADQKRREEIEEEREQCNAHLQKAAYKGKPRTFKTQRDNERSRITHAINDAIKAIKGTLPDAADYLNAHIRTGMHFIYTGEANWVK